MNIRANNIDIEVQDSHPDGQSRHRPVVLLIMGLAMQLTAWPPSLIKALVDAGYRVICFDNRDIGLSQHFDSLGTPSLIWASLKYRMRMPIKPPYRLEDMAADAVGVLDALHIQRAHIVGVSMGGMIAQRVAIAAPERVASLTSIMSTSGARGLPEARPAVLKALLGKPKSSDLQDVLAYNMQLFKAIGSPGFPMAEAELKERVLVGLRRNYHPSGAVRQMLAIAADVTRARQLEKIAAPTLVLHGKADPLVPFGCGVDTAKRIAGSRLVGIEGMGHDLPPGVVQQLLANMLPFLAQQVQPAQAQAATSSQAMSA